MIGFVIQAWKDISSRWLSPPPPSQTTLRPWEELHVSLFHISLANRRSRLTLQCNTHNQRMLCVVFTSSSLTANTEPNPVSPLSPSHLHSSDIIPTYTHCKQKWLTCENCVLDSVLQGYHTTPHTHIVKGRPMFKQYLIDTIPFSLPLTTGHNYYCHFKQRSVSPQ